MSHSLFVAVKDFLPQASRCRIYWVTDGLAGNQKFDSAVLLAAGRIIV
jgi:hypothetical protein